MREEGVRLSKNVVRVLRCPKTGKTIYPSEERALSALQSAWKPGKPWDNKHGKMPRKVYRCPHCNWWHLSSARG